MNNISWTSRMHLILDQRMEEFGKKVRTHAFLNTMDELEEEEALRLDTIRDYLFSRDLRRMHT